MNRRGVQYHDLWDDSRGATDVHCRFQRSTSPPPHRREPSIRPGATGNFLGTQLRSLWTSVQSRILWGKYLDPLPRSCCSKAKGSKSKEIQEVGSRKSKRMPGVGTRSNTQEPGTGAKTGAPLPSTAVPLPSRVCFPWFQLSTVKVKVKCGPEADDLLTFHPVNSSLMLRHSPHSLSSQRHTTTTRRLRTEQQGIFGETAFVRHHEKGECRTVRYFERQRETPGSHNFYYSVVITVLFHHYCCESPTAPNLPIKFYRKYGHTGKDMVSTGLGTISGFRPPLARVDYDAFLQHVSSEGGMNT